MHELWPSRERYVTARNAQAGASILASLVIIAALGGFALVADLSNPSGGSQVAATAATEGECKEGYELRRAVSMKAKAGNGKVLSQPCQPGFAYEIQESEGEIVVTAKAPRGSEINPPTGKTEYDNCPSKEEDEKASKPESADATYIAHVEAVTPGIAGPSPEVKEVGEPSDTAESAEDKDKVCTREVKACFPKGKNQQAAIGHCLNVKTDSGKGKRGCSKSSVACDGSMSLGAINAEMRKVSIADLLDGLSTSGEFKQALTQLNSMGVESSVINTALEAKSDAIEERIEGNKSKIEEIENIIKGCEGSATGGGCSVTGDKLQPLRDQKDELEDENADYRKRLASLNDAKKTLAAIAKEGPPVKKDDSADKGGCAPNCGPTGPGGPGGPQPSTFPPSGQPGGNPGGSPGGAPPGQQGQGLPQSPFGGECDTRNVCSGNTLYYQSSQGGRCNIQPLQQCQYGCMPPPSGGGSGSNTGGNVARIASGVLGIVSSFFGGGGGSAANFNTNSSSPMSSACALTPQEQAPYGRGTDGRPCQKPPEQPPQAQCSAGVWRPTSSTGNSCTTGWQCVPNSGGGEVPTATMSCQPKVADAGMMLSISYSCSAGTSEGLGFATSGAQSGEATTTIAAPPAGTNSATYALTCTNEGRTAKTECSVQIGKPSIVFIANPEAVRSGEPSALGWVSAGMKSCVVSSPDLPTFTQENANDANANGTAATPPLTTAATFFLTCETLGGGTREASATVNIL